MLLMMILWEDFSCCNFVTRPGCRRSHLDLGVQISATRAVCSLPQRILQLTCLGSAYVARGCSHLLLSLGFVRAKEEGWLVPLHCQPHCNDFGASGRVTHSCACIHVPT